MVEGYTVITEPRVPHDEEKQEMNVQHALNTEKHSDKDSNIIRQDVTCSSSHNDAHHDGVSQQLTQQSVKGASTKRASATRMKFNKNSNTRVNDDQHRNQAEILLNENSIRLRPIKKPRQRRTWFIWIVSVIQITVFIGELANNWLITGKLIETQLSINPLFGPSIFALINMGAFYPPCMHTMKDIIDVETIRVPCPNSTTLGKYRCTLSDLCGFNGVSSTPNQWYRFLIPIFLHAGIIHIVLNLFSQLVLGSIIERKIGMIRLAIIYFASGIFGFVFSGNFGPDGAARVGCSGSVFAILALYHLNLYYNWREIENPRRQFIFLFLEIIFNFALGLLPGIDNFGHIGGFCMGLLLGLALMGPPANFRRRERAKRRINEFGESYDSRKYRQFFHNRSKNWWIWWLVRFITFATAVVMFVILAENFYTQKIKCSWCKYISCLPIKNWCDVGSLKKIKNTP